jgi:hypothetical protein
MTLGHPGNVISTKDLESLLSEVFIPVEPRDVFIHRLKARLLRYKGNRLFSIWMLMSAIAMASMLILTWIGIVLRLVLLLASFISVIDKRRRTQRDAPIATAGSSS